MKTFAEIHARALARHGQIDLESRLPAVRTAAQIRALGDDRILASMSKRVFAAGFQWRVIEVKWPGFEEAFHGFDPAWVAAADADAVELLAQDTRIVRNRPKILSTIKNGQFVRKIAAEHGSFGAWLAAWPADDTVGLWEALKEGGDRLGGETGAYFLRDVGRDTFRLSDDVVAALVDAGAVAKKPTGKKDLRAAQDAFNAFAAESGLPLGHVSVILGCSIGEVRGRYGEV